MKAGRPKYRGVAPLMAGGSKMSRQECEQWREAHTWDPARESRLAVQSDLAPAAWIEPLLFGDWSEVRVIVPQGFEAYARIFFPFVGADIVADGETGPLPPARAAQRIRRLSE